MCFPKKTEWKFVFKRYTINHVFAFWWSSSAIFSIKSKLWCAPEFKLFLNDKILKTFQCGNFRQQLTWEMFNLIWEEGAEVLDHLTRGAFEDIDNDQFLGLLFSLRRYHWSCLRGGQTSQAPFCSCCYYRLWQAPHLSPWTFPKSEK